MPIEQLIKNATGLPDRYVEMAVSYIQFLQVQYKEKSRQKSAGAERPVLRKAGMYHGMGRISDDFDAPLDDFKEYMP